MAAETAPGDADVLAKLLLDYADALVPWARRTAEHMVAEVAKREARSTQAERAGEVARRQSNRMYELLQRELATTEKGEIFRALQEQQVDLITSLPRGVAKRVQEIASGSAFAGATPKVVIAEIMKAAGVAENRARLIARTETARAFSNMTQARAMSAGSTHYVWRSAKDRDVRETHRALNGHTFAWNDPPVAEKDGSRHHPGQGINCRCVAIPLFPDDRRR